MKLVIVLIGLECIVLAYGYPQWNFSQGHSMATNTFRRNPFLPISPASAQINAKPPRRTTTTANYRNPFLPNPPHTSPQKPPNNTPPRTGATTQLRNPFLPNTPPASESVTRLPTANEGCGYKRNPSGSSLGMLVVGGMDSELGTWPWVVLLGYSDGQSASQFRCGGTLITSRHVLTAAHCILSGLSFVRLGEHDLSTNTEARHIDVPISKFLKHSEYNRMDGRNDIALLYLDRNVQFTNQIAPICLPLTSQLRRKSYVNHPSVVAGWGRTTEGGRPARVLQQLSITVYNNSVCADSYRRQNRLVSQQQFDNCVLCAGDLAGGKDPCQGDSGGPLMISERIGGNNHFVLIGIVSYGIGCARPEIPGVYSRVAYFIDWIQRGCSLV